MSVTDTKTKIEAVNALFNEANGNINLIRENLMVQQKYSVWQVTALEKTLGDMNATLAEVVEAIEQSEDIQEFQQKYENLAHLIH